MINLLPTETRQSIMYARRNTVLLHWSFGLVAAMAGVVLIMVLGQFYINNVGNNIQRQVAQGTAELEEQKLSETQVRVQEISSSLKLSLQVLSRQILFSSLLRQIGSAMPSGSALTNLSISQIEGGIDLQVDTLDYQTATQVQLNLSDPANKIFSRADILGITCNENEENESPYPCHISLRAEFDGSSDFKFLSALGATQ